MAPSTPSPAYFRAHGDRGRAWRRLTQGPAELYFIGASVTSQRDSWADRLAAKARERTGHAHSLVKNAMGGVGLLFGVANHRPAAGAGSRRLAFIEFSTGDLNLGLTPLDRLEAWLEHLVHRLSEEGVPTVIVHNWRGDFAVDDAPGIRARYDAVAARHGLPVIENHRLAAELLDGGTVAQNSLFRDVCHTQPDGAELYADHALRCLEAMASGSAPDAADAARHDEADIAPPHDIGFFDLPSEVMTRAGIERSSYTYPTTLQTFPVWNFASGRALDMVTSGSLLGVAFLSGPRTGWVDLSIDGRDVRRFRCFDRNSHYERYILLPSVFSLSRSNIRLRCAPAEVDFAIASKPHPDYALPRQMKLVQLAGSNLVVHSAQVVACTSGEPA